MDRLYFVLKHFWKPGLFWSVGMGLFQWIDLFPPQIVIEPMDVTHWLSCFIAGLLFFGPIFTFFTYKDHSA